eukprot:gene13305-28190_t
MTSGSYNLSFIVFGDPVPLSRHMMSNNRMYNPSSTSQRHFLQACEKHLPSEPYLGPLEVFLAFYFTRPKSHYRTGKYSHILKEDAPSWHTSRKDIDNLAKFVLDALNEKAYVDDRQIVAIHAYKMYTNNKARVVVRMKEFQSSFISSEP